MSCLSFVCGQVDTTIFSNKLNSEEVEKKSAYWFSIGLGFSVAGGEDLTTSGGGLAGRLEASIELSPIVIGIHQTINTGGSSSFQGFLGGNLKDEFYETAFILGFVLHAKDETRIIFSSGASRVGGKRVVSNPGGFFGNATTRKFDPVFGLPLEVTVIGGKAKGTNMGISFYGNLNKVENFFGLTLNLNIGRFNNKKSAT